MNHLPFTLSAYFLNALSVLSTKFLLSKAISDPLVYIFYISLISFLAIFALPFTKIPDLSTLTLASSSTLLWTLGAYFMFKALKTGSVTRVIPVIGTLIPLLLLIFASETRAISYIQIWAVLLLTGGMGSLTLPDWQGRQTRQEIWLEVLSALFFAVSYIILRQAYLTLDFFSTLVWSRLILLPLGLVVVAIPGLRRKIIASSRSLSSRQKPGSIKSGLIFLGGQISGAASEFLILFSISLANPALVNSLQGTQYVFLLIFSREKYPLSTLISKASGIILIGLGLYLLAFMNF